MGLAGLRMTASKAGGVGGEKRSALFSKKSALKSPFLTRAARICFWEIYWALVSMTSRCPPSRGVMA